MRIKGSTYWYGTKILGWHHLAFVIERTSDITSNVKVYRNGTLLWEYTLPAIADYVDDRPWSLGQEYDGCDLLSNFFQGEMDEVVFYNRVLTDEEILLLYDN